MPGEDLVAPVDDGVDDGVELTEFAGGVEVGEPVKRFEGAIVVVGEIEAVEFLEGISAGSQLGWVAKSFSRRAWSCSLRWSARCSRAKRALNRSGVECRFDAGRLAALQISAHQREALGEPANDMEPVQHMAGVTEMGVDGCLVGLRPVRDDHLDAAAPAWPLFDEKPGQRSSVAMLDHGQDLAGVCVDDHRHVAVAFAHRGLIDQQHPTTTAAAMLGHQRRPRRDQVLDQMPVKAMAANHRAN